MLYLLLTLATGALLVTVGLLSLEIRQRRQLLAWLHKPALGSLPDGIGAWRDIFSAQQQLQKLYRREAADLSFRLERFLQATQTIPDGVVLLDPDNRIEWLNGVAARLLSVNVERDRGTLIVQLVRQPAFRDYLQHFNLDPSGDFEGLTLDMGDPAVAVQLKLLQVGRHGALLMLRDVSQAMLTERMRRDFVANVSHELRTPVTVVAGFLEQMTGEHPPEGDDARRFLALMADQTERMRRLIEDLLTLSRLESEVRVVREEIVDVPDMLAPLLAEAQSLSAGRHTISIGAVDDVCLNANPDELRSAFGNLLTNAIRYTPDPGNIVLRWQLKDGIPVFSVQDSGIGIAAEHIPRLTERFYRVDRGRSSATGGTGLGLAIVKHVLSRHGGRLRIESTPGKGSTFSACFPPERLVCNLRAEQAPRHFVGPVGLASSR